MKRKGWFGTVALAVIIGLGISVMMGTTQVSANTKEVANDSMDPQDATVIELNLNVETTTPVENDEVDVTEGTESAKTETTEPSTTTQETVEKEKEEKVETKEETTTSHECDHLWKCEYQPATETEAGHERMDCLKCGESYIVKTYPPKN